MATPRGGGVVWGRAGEISSWDDQMAATEVMEEAELTVVAAAATVVVVVVEVTAPAALQGLS